MKKRVGSGYSTMVVMLGLGLFALVYAALIFVSGQTNTLIAAQGPAFTNSFDPSTSIGMNDLLFPGIGIFVGVSAILEIINQNQKRRNGGEDYVG